MEAVEIEIHVVSKGTCKALMEFEKHVALLEHDMMTMSAGQ